MAPTVARSPMPDTPSHWPVLQAPPHWRHVDFISDLHLQDGDEATFLCWQDYMRTTCADAVFILGDLFEVWVGDDVANPSIPERNQQASFEVQCANLLKQVSAHLKLYFMHGNRDFLLGSAFAQACGLTLLDDPSVLAFAGQRCLLSHGDLLCLSDSEYQQFRTRVRSSQWQHDFLRQPLAQRLAQARALRAQSEARKHSAANVYADLDEDACREWLDRAGASVLIHGHTHRPAEHHLTGKMRRIVLSDWDGAASPPRAEVLRLSQETSNGCTVGIHRLPAALATRCGGASS